MRMVIAVCASVFAATPAAAENWVRVGGDAQMGEFVDADSVQRVGDEVRFRREVRYAAPRPEGFDRMVFSHVGSCRERMTFVLSMSFRIGDHELMSTTFRESDRDNDPAPMGTALGRALHYACEGVTEG